MNEIDNGGNEREMSLATAKMIVMTDTGTLRGGGLALGHHMKENAHGRKRGGGLDLRKKSARGHDLWKKNARGREVETGKKRSTKTKRNTSTSTATVIVSETGINCFSC